MDRPAAAPEFQLVFWVLYSLAITFCAGFFLWNLLRYVLPHRFQRQDHTTFKDLPTADLVPEIVALEAQFLVAPKLAIAEAQKALEGAYTVYKSDTSGEDLAGQFDALIVALARQKAYRQLREV